MQPYIKELRTAIDRGTPALLVLSESESSHRPAPGRWSPREVIGHLVDSASNNHQRFVRAQFQDDLIFPGYEQDAWVGVQRYQDVSWTDLVALWRAFNLHMVWVMTVVPESARLQVRECHNLDKIAWQTVPATEPTTLDYFMMDYVGHLRHHLVQILGAGWDDAK